MIPIFDAHLDLAWSAVFFNRDLSAPLSDVRAHERAMTDEPGRGRGTVTLPELRRAGVGVCVATLLARGGPGQKRQDGEAQLDCERHVSSTPASTGWFRC